MKKLFLLVAVIAALAACAVAIYTAKPAPPIVPIGYRIVPAPPPAVVPPLQISSALELARVAVGGESFAPPTVLGKSRVVWPLFTVPADGVVMLHFTHAVDLESLFAQTTVLPARPEHDDFFIRNPADPRQVTLTFDPPLTTERKVTLRIRAGVAATTDSAASELEYLLVLTAAPSV